MRLLVATPTRFATVVNGLSAVVGFGVSAFVARLLGPAQLGVVAVIAGINSSILAFFDVRLNDVSAKVFFRPETDDTHPLSYQAGVLWLGLAGTAAIALLTALLTTAVGPSLVPYFTQRPMRSGWIAAGAFAAAMDVISSGMLFLTQMRKDFYVLSAWRFAAVLTGAGATVGILAHHADLGHYYRAVVLAAIAQLLCCALAWTHVWGWRARLPLSAPDWRRARKAFRGHFSFLWYGNLLGYAKLLQKSADVLIVAYFANESVTGLYKFSRQMIEQGLAIFQGALYEVYFPQLLHAFSQRATDTFRQMARRLLSVGGGLTLLFLAGEALLLPHLIGPVFGNGYIGALWPMMLLTATFFFLVGCHPWLWSLFVGSGEMRDYTMLSFLAVIAQYTTLLLLFRIFGPSATAAMAGMVAHYLFLGPALVILTGRRQAAYLPFGGDS
jgi:O-antigen/teichoic acid export membrane protein